MSVTQSAEMSPVIKAMIERVEWLGDSLHQLDLDSRDQYYAAIGEISRYEVATGVDLLSENHHTRAEDNHAKFPPTPYRKVLDKIKMLANEAADKSRLGLEKWPIHERLELLGEVDNLLSLLVGDRLYCEDLGPGQNRDILTGIGEAILKGLDLESIQAIQKKVNEIVADRHLFSDRLSWNLWLTLLGHHEIVLKRILWGHDPVNSLETTH